MNKTLWQTEIGSRMWNMQREDSDTDIFKAYIIPTTDILSGKNKGCGSHFNSTDKIDTTSHEIGKIIDMLIRGNVNFIWSVMSPIIVDDSEELRELRTIVENNVAKNCFHSIHGLAVHNYKRYIENDKDLSSKRINTIIRTLFFGMNLLEKGEFHFDRLILKYNKKDVEESIHDLEEIYNITDLPEKPDEKPYRDYLLKLRLKELGLVGSDVLMEAWDNKYDKRWDKVK